MISVDLSNVESIESSNHLYQWDKGQQLEIKGLSLSNAPEVHFGVNGSMLAIVVNSTLSGGIVYADIPNEILMSGKDLRVYVHIDGTTIKNILIPVFKRNMPENYVVDTGNVTWIEEFETEANEITTAKLTEIDRKGTQTLDSIPNDYTALQDEVTKARLNTSGITYSTLKLRLDAMDAETAAKINTSAVESTLADSTNPVQSKVVKEAVTDLKSDLNKVINSDNLLLQAELFENQYYDGRFLQNNTYSVFVLPVEANVSYKISLAPRWLYVDTTSMTITGNIFTPTVSGTAYITVYNSDRNNWALCLNDKDIAKVGTYDEPVAKDSFVKNVMATIALKADETEIQEIENEISKKQDAIYKKSDLSLYFESGFINTSMNVYPSTEGKHIIINVVEGEQYEISGTSNNGDYQGAWFANDSTFVKSLYKGNAEEFSNVIVTIPSGVNKLVVNGNNTKTKLSAYKLDMITVEDITGSEDFEIKALEKRVLRAEKNNDFAWKKFDKAYFVFVHDDTNAFLPTALNVFESKNVPLSSATIVDYLNTVPSGQNKKIEEILHELVANGGEVLCHYDYSLTQEMSEEIWNKYAVEPLKILTEKGFDVNGILIANQTENRTEKGEAICRKYYRYSDGMGYSTQYRQNRQGVGGFSVDRFKQFVDESCSQKGFFPICFHGLRDSEIIASAENLATVIDYIQSKGELAEITTYKSVFDRFGSTVLEERISALENR